MSCTVCVSFFPHLSQENFLSYHHKPSILISYESQRNMAFLVAFLTPFRYVPRALTNLCIFSPLIFYKLLFPNLLIKVSFIYGLSRPT